MKFRSLILATVVLLGLVGALYWSEHRKADADTAKASADTPPAIVHTDDSAITKFQLKKKDAEPIVLEKSSSGVWRIIQPKNLPADQSAVTGVVSSLSSLNSERLVEDKASDLKQYGLDQPANEVGFTGKNNRTQELLIGDETPTGGAAYAKLGGDPRVFTIASYTKNSFEKSLNDLRDKRLLTVTPGQVSRLELVRKNQTIEFGRNKDDWQILRPAPQRADSGQVSELLRKLTDVHMDISGAGSGPKEAESAFVHGAPIATAKVTSQSGSQELQIRKSKDSYYAKSSVVDGTYKVDSGVGEEVDKGLDDFRNRKVFDFGYNDPDKVEIHSGAKAYFLTRSGADWWSNGKKMDAESVQALTSKLRDLSATKFAASGFDTPSMQISVTSDSGKRVEGISIAKFGNGYVAKRENEPTLYVLDSSAVDDAQKSAADLKLAPVATK